MIAAAWLHGFVMGSGLSAILLGLLCLRQLRQMRKIHDQEMVELLLRSKAGML